MSYCENCLFHTCDTVKIACFICHTILTHVLSHYLLQAVDEFFSKIESQRLDLKIIQQVCMFAFNVLSLCAQMFCFST